jgi:hypothetical protein
MLVAVPFGLEVHRRLDRWLDVGVVKVFWVYDNRVHKFARIHRAECTFCDSGRGLHRRGTKAVAGGRLGPFGSVAEAARAAEGTGRSFERCSICAPA